MSAALISLVSALAVAVVTFLATRWKVQKDFQLETLRSDRLAVYRKLWAITEPLAFYGREKDLTYGDLRSLAVKLRRWYYQVGGIFLSKASYDCFMALQTALQTPLTSKGADLAQLVAVETEFAKIQKCGSALRTSLAGDVGGRREGLDPGKTPPDRLPDLARPGT